MLTDQASESQSELVSQGPSVFSSHHGDSRARGADAREDRSNRVILSRIISSLSTGTSGNAHTFYIFWSTFFSGSEMVPTFRDTSYKRVHGDLLPILYMYLHQGERKGSIWMLWYINSHLPLDVFIPVPINSVEINSGPFSLHIFRLCGWK